MRRASRTTVVLTVALIVLASIAVAQATLPAEQPDVTGMISGKVRAIAQASGDIWLGGTFGTVQDSSGNAIRSVDNLVAFNSNTGQLDTSVHLPAFTEASGAIIYDMSVGPDGNLYVAGKFTQVDGLNRKNVAAIDPDTGALLPFNPGTAAATSILATASAVYVGNSSLLSFQLNGVPTPDYSPPTVQTIASLRAHTTPPQFRRIAEVGRTLVAACQCDTLHDARGTHDVKAVVQIDADTGNLTGWAPGGLNPAGAAFGISLVVHDAPVGGLPTIYLAAGGSDFTAAYDLATGAERWKTDTSGSSQAITWWQGDLVVGGHFDWTKSPTAAAGCGNNANPNTDCYHSPKLVALDPATGAVRVTSASDPWNPGICCKYNGVWALLTDTNGSDLHVGGEFTEAGGTWVLQSGVWQLHGAPKHNYYARFSPDPSLRTMTVTAAGSGSGRVTSSPAGIDCPGVCEANFAIGTTLTLKAAAASGSTFSGWGGDCAGTGTCRVSMTTSRDATATFARHAVSSCGKLAFVSDRRGNGDIFTMNPDRSQLRDLTDDPAPDTNPAWSPRCDKIAFASARGGDTNIFVMDADGTNLKPLTTSSGADLQPAWSPDGTQIAFTSERTGDRELFVMDADGARQTQITSNTWIDQQPDWSPDEAKLVFASDRRGAMQIYTMNSDGSGRARITTGRAAADQPAWSPSGSRIAFVSDISGRRQIWSMNADGSGLFRVTRRRARVAHPSWSPGGKRLAYGSTGGGNRQIWTITTSGTRATRVTTGKAADTAPDWS